MATVAGMSVLVPSLRAAVRFCREGLGLSLLDEGRLDETSAAAWGAAQRAGARVVVMGSQDHPLGALRYVEAPDAWPGAPLRRLGWAASELVVPSLDAVERRLEALGLDGVRRLRPPGLIASGQGALRAAQWVGPEGEVLYLTEISGEVPGFWLPRSADAATHLFALVAASARLEATRSWLVELLRVPVASDHPVAVGVLNDAFGLAPTCRHRISSLQLDGPSLIEVDQYPSAADPSGAPGASVAGAVMATVVDAAAVEATTLGWWQMTGTLHRGPDGLLLQVAGVGGELGGTAVPLGGLPPLLYRLQIALAALTAAVLWYFGVSQSKRIGVMRLGGHSPARIWWTLVGQFVLVVVCGSALASELAVYVLDGGRAGLTSGALRTGLLSDVLSLIASLVP